MLKTLSAALLAASVLAAPAFAASKTTQAPVTKSTTQTQANQAKATPAPAETPAKSSAMNANAKMGKHYTKHVRQPGHKKMAVKRTHHAKVSFKHASPTSAKRG